MKLNALLLATPLLAAPLLTTLTGCQALYKTVQPQWVEGEAHTTSEKVLFESILIALNKTDYPVGIGANPGKREVVSGWYRSESPFKGRGYREMATVRYEKLSDGVFLVRVRIARETNESLRPLDPTAADWKEAEDEPGRARVVLQFVQSSVGVPPLEISEERPRDFH
jgi:hypothetical protein